MIHIALAEIPPARCRRDAEKAATARALEALVPGAVLAHDANGAPYIAAHPETAVSVSHNRRWAAVAVSDATVGIDIETDRTPQLRKVARRYLSDNELRAAELSDLGFLKAWTAKEAVFKAGRGCDVAYIADIVLETSGFGCASAGGKFYSIEYFKTDGDTLIAVAHHADRHNKIDFVTLYERELIPERIGQNHTATAKPKEDTVKKTPRKLVFATNNAHKLSEMRRIVDGRFEILSLDDIGCRDDIPEDAATLEGNALAKARWVVGRYGYDCFADDTGLEVDALGGEPGVRSARYAPGEGHDAKANTALLLNNLAGTPADRRTARFRTVIALIIDGRTYTFEGRVEGIITESPAGDGGFGYDPVFRPEGFDRTFAELSADTKNAVSHRGKATRRLLEFLATID